jgi:xanthine/CO dehydrogenase XdhC/CoxF family maturation factor
VGDSAAANLLAQLGHQLGWRTTVVSTREAVDRVPDGLQRVYKTPAALIADLPLDAQTSVVVMTHRLELDLAYVAPLLATPVRYVGVIGSRQRADQVRTAFPRADDRLHVPAGLDVGSETPQEIALAIAAEILALRNGRSGGSLVHTRTSIHP